MWTTGKYDELQGFLIFNGMYISISMYGYTFRLFQTTKCASEAFILINRGKQFVELSQRLRDGDDGAVYFMLQVQCFFIVPFLCLHHFSSKLLWIQTRRFDNACASVRALMVCKQNKCVIKVNGFTNRLTWWVLKCTTLHKIHTDMYNSIFSVTKNIRGNFTRKTNRRKK